MLDDFGLTTVVSDDGEPGTIYTPLGVELNVELMSIFAGAVGLWDIPLLLDLMGHLDDEEAETIDASISRHPEHVIRQLVRRVYFKFCNPSKLLNRSEPVIQPARRGIKTRSGAPCKSALSRDAGGAGCTDGADGSGASVLDATKNEDRTSGAD